MPRRAMPPAGRPRKHNPDIARLAPHIDQAALPKGLYFNGLGKGRWWRREGEEKVYVAGASAKLSDLHAIMEGKAGTDSVDWLCAQHAASDRVMNRAKATRDDYAYCAKVVCEFRLKDGSRFGALNPKQLTGPVLQRLIDALARGTGGRPTPSKAAHVGRYLGALLRWGGNRGHCLVGIAVGLELPEEKADARVPERDEMRALIAFARQQGARRGVRDAVPPYLWAVGELAYRCRLRRCEVLDLTDAHALPAGVFCERRKGSEDNVTEWATVREAWDFLAASRDAVWNRRKRPVPMRATDRPLVVARDGEPLAPRALTQAWRRLVLLAIREGVVSQKFGLHGLKHRGITDTPGTRADKREASGHKTEAMVAHYDHALVVVPGAGTLGTIPAKTAERPGK